MPAGAPPVFAKLEQLEQKIAEYFEYIKGEFEELPFPKTNKDGSVEEVLKKVYTRDPEFPSITGLALFLGFESRQSIYDYEKKGKFSYTIKRARTRVEAAYEQQLNSQNPSGAIFALKNFGWADRLQQEITGKDGEKLNLNPVVKVITSTQPLSRSEKDVDV